MTKHSAASNRARTIALRALTAATLLAPLAAVAGGMGGGGAMPWDTWFTQIQASITGPVAFAFALIGIVVATLAERQARPLERLPEAEGAVAP